MEIIFIVLIFIVPGLVIKRLSELAEKRDVKEKERPTIYESLFDVCVLSILASAATIILLNLFSETFAIEKTKGFDELFLNLGNFNYLIKYSTAIAVITMIEYFIYRGYLKKMRERVSKNWEEDFGLNAVDEDHRTVWEEFFLNKERNRSSEIVSIYKDGNYIISGVLQARNVNLNERKEFELTRVTEIEQILKRDEKLPPEEKSLNYIKDSYFDMETGVLFNFYDSDFTIEHWEEIMKEING